MAQVLAEADPKDKAEVYADLGIAVTYDPDQRKVVAEARPSSVCNRTCRRGDLNPHEPKRH